jgi:hypothetical protein
MVKHFLLLALCFSTWLMVTQSPNVFGFICLLHLLNVTKVSVGRAGTNPSTTLYIKTDLPTDPLLAVHTRKNALSPAPDHDPRRVIVFTCKITHQKLMPNG